MLRIFEHGRQYSTQKHLEFEHDGSIVQVALKRVATSKRFTLRVRAATRDVVLTMPHRGALKEARAFVERNAGWISARLARLPKPIALEPGARTLLRGVEHEIVHRPQSRGVVWIEHGSGRPRICVAGQFPHVQRRIVDFLRREARRDLEAAVEKYARALDVRAPPIALRDPSSRWGSCSSTGRLNFSWRLILAPPFVLDYLAAHEVSHLRHMNHSAAFWRLTKRICPETSRAELWLKAYGAALHRYGVPNP